MAISPYFTILLISTRLYIFGALQWTAPNSIKPKMNSLASLAVCLSIGLGLGPAQQVEASMLTLPLPYPLKNSVTLVRSGESFADEKRIVETAPVKKLSTANALTPTGRDQAIAAAKQLSVMGIEPTFIFTSNTERAYETAAIIARELRIGQNRIIPEFSFLDARGMGEYEGTDSDSAYAQLHEMDEKYGVNYKGNQVVSDESALSPPPQEPSSAVNEEAVALGVPTDSINDVLVRGRQLLSTFESMYSGEQVLVVSPDSEILSILTAALTSENPDTSLPTHSRFAFKNGELRVLNPVVVTSTLLVTGQTQEEADVSNRLMRAMRVRGSVMAGPLTEAGKPDWFTLYSTAVDAVRD